MWLVRPFYHTLGLPHRLLARSQIAGVAGERLPDQLREVVARFALETQPKAFTRCVRCNEPLHRVEPAEAVGQVPPDVAAHQSEFWRCPQCGKVYWQGSHVRARLARLKQWLAEP